ncbi:MAG: hypothetical protein H7Y30_08805 [Pyrinomonadaceae bacterium]|nr:hypothetical protein [Pyrinomonadaceae bacterium]
MVTVLIASFILLAAISFAIYRFRQNALPGEQKSQALPPPPDYKGLFDASGEEARFRAEQFEKELAEKRRDLLARAASGDKETLDEAHLMRESDLYDEVLSALVGRAENEKQLLSLASYISRSDSLPVNKKFVEAFIGFWKISPDRRTTAKMLHLAAKAGDAVVYQNAIESALQSWRERKLPDTGAEELAQLIESEFWILPAGARNSGAGFLLKRELAKVRRELAAHNNKTVMSDE